MTLLVGALLCNWSFVAIFRFMLTGTDTTPNQISKLWLAIWKWLLSEWIICRPSISRPGALRARLQGFSQLLGSVLFYTKFLSQIFDSQAKLLQSQIPRFASCPRLQGSWPEPSNLVLTPPSLEFDDLQKEFLMKNTTSLTSKSIEKQMNPDGNL